ncbi:MAG: hypothetical protein P8N40_05890, partial [Gammaproteobacteria bacterium]|nr:hypothetical protein [Gammaproteobacteria bacterium]
MMKIEELTRIFENYGASPEGWPANKKIQIEELLKNEQKAKILKQEFYNLEKSLNQVYVPDFAELEQHILKQDLPPRTDSFFEKFLNWLFPAGNNFKNLWRPAAAACIPLIFGATLGNNFTFGVDISFEENE